MIMIPTVNRLPTQTPEHVLRQNTLMTHDATLDLEMTLIILDIRNNNWMTQGTKNNIMIIQGTRNNTAMTQSTRNNTLMTQVTTMD